MVCLSNKVAIQIILQGCSILIFLYFRKGDVDYKEHNGNTYKKKKCGFKMVVYKNKKPSGGHCNLGPAQAIIDNAVTAAEDSDDIKEIIKNALEDKGIKYSFLITHSFDTENSLSTNLDRTCVVQNNQVHLYLYN